MNGVEFVTKVREFAPTIPVLVISGMEEAEAEYDGLNIHFRTKPVQPEALIACVSALLSKPPPQTSPQSNPLRNSWLFLPFCVSFPPLLSFPLLFVISLLFVIPKGICFCIRFRPSLSPPQGTCFFFLDSYSYSLAFPLQRISHTPRTPIHQI